MRLMQGAAALAALCASGAGGASGGPTNLLRALSSGGGGGGGGGDPWADPDFRDAMRAAGKGKLKLLADQESAQEDARSANKGADPGAQGPVPSSVDWRPELTDVKFQGPCGVCWAFVATAMAEFRLAQDHNVPLVSLSEQAMLDCNRQGVNDGCNGGNFFSALSNFAGALLAEEDFPFISDAKAQAEQQRIFDAEVEGDGGDEACASEYGGGAAVARVDVSREHILFVEPRTEYALMRAVAQGPVGVAISGYGDEFMTYKGGVFQPEACDQDVDHAALVVGYGTTEAGEDYWILRNSWSTTWGEEGYMRLKRNTQSSQYPYGSCGVLTQANYLLPGAIRCELPPNNAATEAAGAGDASGCAARANPHFCTREHGCQDAAFFAKSFSTEPDTLSPGPGDAPAEAASAATVALLASGCVLVAVSAAYVLYTKTHKPHLSGAKPATGTLTVAAFKPQPAEASETEMRAVDEMRGRLRDIQALRRRAAKESDDVLLGYLREFANDVSAAVDAYAADKQ